MASFSSYSHADTPHGGSCSSLPELVTSFIAAHRGQSDIVVGNVVGSNIFNVLLCLGLAAVSEHLETTMRTFLVDLEVLVLLTCACAFYIRSERTISRAEGAILPAIYGAFLSLTVAHA